MLDDIKLLLGIASDDKDELLELMLTQATREFVRMTNRKETGDYKDIIEKMVVYNYNRLGTEGLDSESYSGVSYSYSSGYPDTIMSAIRSASVLRILW